MAGFAVKIDLEDAARQAAAAFAEFGMKGLPRAIQFSLTGVAIDGVNRWREAIDARAVYRNPPETLLGYAAHRRWEILDEGRVQVGQASVPTNDYTQGKLTGGALKATRNPAYSIESWKVAEGVFVVLDAQTIIRFADAGEERVQEMFNRESACTAAIKAGTMTTTAQAEVLLSAPSQVGVP